MNQKKDEKLLIFANEEFKEIKLEGKLQLRYAISNFGRLLSFTETFEDGRILKGSMIEGYRIFRYKIRVKNKIKHKHKFFYRLVAEYFIEKESEDQTCVLHLDHNLANDYFRNLRWANKQEMYQHHRTSPKVIASKKISTKRIVEYNRNREGTKLTSTKVMLIKKLLANPNRKTRLKIIAKQFGISEMQLYRIKTGENWRRVKI
jgi:hypothetical protein